MELSYHFYFALRHTVHRNILLRVEPIIMLTFPPDTQNCNKYSASTLYEYCVLEEDEHNSLKTEESNSKTSIHRTTKSR